ncbi:MAG: DUF4304 domain-containing protein [Candidatus Lokiarchaeota archaeon]|nr:DUF4304 domain-containing protein [Candidatus Lokiarchaeota archaeon]
MIINTVISYLSSILKTLGYRKTKNNFWKHQNEFYNLINFQKGAYGDYFFINIGIHPIGLPLLTELEDFLPEKPKEYECLIRTRIENLLQDYSHKILDKGFMCYDITIKEWEDFLEMVFPTDVHNWITEFSSFTKLISMSQVEMERLMPYAPIVKEKIYFMTRFYCFYKLNKINEAQIALEKYNEINLSEFNFSRVDIYLNNLINND